MWHLDVFMSLLLLIIQLSLLPIALEAHFMLVVLERQVSKGPAKLRRMLLRPPLKMWDEKPGKLACGT